MASGESSDSPQPASVTAIPGAVRGRSGAVPARFRPGVGESDHRRVPSCPRLSPPVPACPRLGGRFGILKRPSPRPGFRASITAHASGTFRAPSKPRETGMTEENNYLSTHQAARLLGLSAKTLARYRVAERAAERLVRPLPRMGAGELAAGAEAGVSRPRPARRPPGQPEADLGADGRGHRAGPGRAAARLSGLGAAGAGLDRTGAGRRRADGDGGRAQALPDRERRTRSGEPGGSTAGAGARG